MSGQISATELDRSGVDVNQSGSPQPVSGRSRMQHLEHDHSGVSSFEVLFTLI